MPLLAAALPFLVTGLGGMVGGMALGDILGGGKKAEPMTTQAASNVYHAPYETYAPSVQYAPQATYSYQGAQYIINSPYASTKKEQTVSAEQTPNLTPTYSLPQTYTQTQTPTSTSGISNETIMIVALIGGAAIVGYAFFR